MSSKRTYYVAYDDHGEVEVMTRQPLNINHGNVIIEGVGHGKTFARVRASSVAEARQEFRKATHTQSGGTITHP
jgi:hypothetical protein